MFELKTSNIIILYKGNENFLWEEKITIPERHVIDMVQLVNRRFRSTTTQIGLFTSPSIFQICKIRLVLRQLLKAITRIFEKFGKLICNFIGKAMNPASEAASLRRRATDLSYTC